ncbi:MAG TPA: rhomboid family intramembrane serine protease [Baekduia sp.]|nr:rhomboid family intramembrane serine protease [Baekduia sp.]
MSGGADLFVVCKKCGSEVSPYVTECPYCGTRLRKRAPQIDRGEGGARPRTPKMPSLGPLRQGEIPGIKADPLRRPYATITLVALSLFGFLVVAALPFSDVALTSLWGSDPWRHLTSAFAYSNVWYELTALLAIGLFGWRLELRHGPLVVIALFIVCGFGANALAVEVQSAPFLLGAPGAALGLLAAWAVPDILRSRKGFEYDGDLLGTLVIAVAIALMPLAVPQCSVVATFAGGAAGLLLGLALSRTAAAR